MKYSTRRKLKRIFEWKGKPVSFNRKLRTSDYNSLTIQVEGLPKITTIRPGLHILIEGEDDDNPYVAKVIRLFEDEEKKEKKVMVEWFARAFEVPPGKLKLLGRAPHPQEVFFYRGPSCENEVQVESVIRPVQVIHVPPTAPFPQQGDSETFYAKLFWNCQTFGEPDASPPPPPSSHPDLTRRSPPAAASATPPRSALPIPDPVVMLRAVAVSAGKRSIDVEAESLHSVTKLSAARQMSAKRRGASGGVRKKLELQEDRLLQMMDEELQEEASLAHRLPVSPPPSPLVCTPFRKTTKSSRTPLRPTESPSGRGSSLARHTDLKPVREPALGVLAEEGDESRASLPRSSRRKSSCNVSAQIKKQLEFLDGPLDFSSGEEDEFVPSDSEEEIVEMESDDELAVKRSRLVGRTPNSKPKTPRSTRKTPTRKNAPSTPRTPRTATPSIPSRVVPARRPTNVLEEARSRLHVSSVPESLPCREQEFQDIYSFVESKILDGTGGCMYISGVPGTGKTATVHEVIRCLQHAAEVDEIPPFNFIEINGMKMTDPHQAYVQILQKLTGQKVTADHAAVLLEKRFNAPTAMKQSTVLLVDELDLLWTRKQNVMYNLFDWPTRRHARLVVLTIANTMDLPERIMINRVASRLGLTRMSFQPYSFKQLQQIISSRLNKVKAFEEDALQLVSRKVAALSGDARRCLDICRRATEICELSKSSGLQLVGMSHVMEALNEMFSSAYITAIRCASLQEQLFLRAVIAEFRRSGLEEATFQQVFLQHQALCRVEGLQPLSVSDCACVCQRLGACRLLLVESSRLGLLQRVRLNVSQDDVLFALKTD